MKQIKFWARKEPRTVESWTDEFCSSYLRTRAGVDGGQGALTETVCKVDRRKNPNQAGAGEGGVGGRGVGG